jgi:hypothetical protein
VVAGLVWGYVGDAFDLLEKGIFLHLSKRKVAQKIVRFDVVLFLLFPLEQFLVPLHVT